MDSHRSDGHTTLTPAPSGYAIKLVRDNTAAIINASGEPGDLWYARFPGSHADYLRLLKLKLAEEVGEYLIDGGDAELMDVLAVIEALAYAEHGGALEHLIAAMRRDPRGGFVKGIVMYGRHEEFDK
jgi:predicted house-cleaning noncanonical NTP pyrophosphatase (MazG superfamily)